MGKYELCKHAGERITDGKGLSRLSFCVECGEPILKTVFDLIACLKTPRILQDGKVKKLRWNIYKKIEFSLSYTHLLMRIVKRSEKRGRPKKEEIHDEEDEIEWYEWSPTFMMRIREEEEEEKLPHHEPASNKPGIGRMPGKTYIQFHQCAVEAKKKWQQMMEVIMEVQRKLNERGINEASTFCLFKINERSLDLKLPHKCVVFRPYEVYLKKEGGQVKYILNGEPEKSLIQAYIFTIYLSNLLLSLPKRSMLAVCAASLINTGCSVKEAEEITGVKNLEKIYRFRKLLEKMNKLIWQDERLLKSPRVPLDKKIIGRRGKDGKMRLFKQW